MKHELNDWMPALRDGATALGITLTPAQEDAFARYLELLLDKNEHVNLTAITDPREVAIKHFVDSLTVMQVWKPKPGDRILDIGTGAGLPGLPLAILHPEVAVVLNDSVRKKVDFLHEVIVDLQLANATALWGRAEVLGRDNLFRGKYNAVFARAVAHLAVLSEYALPLLKAGGRLIAMKGPSGEREADESESALQKIGGRVMDVRHFTLPEAGERQLVVVQKMYTTPQEFPREAGMAKKKPLYLDSSRATT